jgi:hypothetical protein
MRVTAWLRFVGFALLGATASAAAFSLWMRGRGGDSAHYELSTAAVIAVFIAAFAASLGIALAVTRYRTAVALLSAVATALLVLGILTMFSIGLILLLASVVFIALTVRAMRKHDRGVATGSAIAGSTTAVGLVVLLLAVSQPAVVECLPGGGVRSSSHYWWGGGPSSGSSSGSSSPDGTATGTMQHGDTTIHYVCRDGRLAEFEKQ